MTLNAWQTDNLCIRCLIGDILPPGQRYYTESKYEEDYHAFWDNVFSSLGEADNSTLLISAATSALTPVGVDFFEMRRRNAPLSSGFSYGPAGILIPLVGYDGSGFFHCVDKSVEALF